MARLHISQDDTGFWQMSFEDDDGALTLISHGFPAPDHLIEDARQLVEKGKVPGAAIVIGPPRAPATTAHAQARREYSKPAPQKVVE
jgi:hypothetical protein